jgi:hypothetical protein
MTFWVHGLTNDQPTSLKSSLKNLSLEHQNLTNHGVFFSSWSNKFAPMLTSKMGLLLGPPPHTH